MAPVPDRLEEKPMFGYGPKVVNLPRPMTGKELVEAVRIATDDYQFGSLYYKEYASGTCDLGQNSGYPHEKIQVATSEDDDRINLSAVYEQVVLLEGPWVGGFDVMGGDSEEAMYGFEARLLPACAGLNPHHPST